MIVLIVIMNIVADVYNLVKKGTTQMIDLEKLIVEYIEELKQYNEESEPKLSGTEISLALGILQNFNKHLANVMKVYLQDTIIINGVKYKRHEY